jgi:hypothetical protein
MLRVDMLRVDMLRVDMLHIDMLIVNAPPRYSHQLSKPVMYKYLVFILF